MIIDRLKLQNFRAAKEIEFNFTNKLNLFVGVNGSGKSTILDALTLSLSWLVKRIERDSGQGMAISDSDITIGEEYSALSIELENDKEEFRWTLSEALKMKSSEVETNLDDLSGLVKAIRQSNEEKMILPVIVYYPTGRVVGKVSPTAQNGNLDDLDLYDNALGGSANYHSFFEWFRLQDDIVNEEAGLRAKWNESRRDELKISGEKILSLLKQFEFESDVDIKILRDFIDSNEDTDQIYNEPLAFLRDLARVLRMIDSDERELFEFTNFVKGQDFLYYNIDILRSYLKKGLREKESICDEIADELTTHLMFTQNYSTNIVRSEFLQLVFTYTLYTSFWWLSNSGKLMLLNGIRLIREQLGTSLSLNDKSNNVKIKLSDVLRQIIKEEIQNSSYQYHYELNLVTNSIENFVPEFSNLRVKRTPRPHMLIDKDGKPFNLDQLSDGEKNLIALVGDIARRLAIANPSLNNPLEGEGVVLIDEIDLHLHPSWQRRVVPKLLEIFPNIQFFLSTHSPQVITHVKPESLFLLEDGDEGLGYRKMEGTYGMSLDRAVELIMNDESRPASVKEALENLFELIERHKFENAQEVINTLKKDMPSDPDLMRAEALLRREMNR